MPTNVSRRAAVLLVGSMGACLIAACAHFGGAPRAASRWQGQVVYTRVGMRVELRRGIGWHMYSTNHIGLPKHFLVGTSFTVRSVGRETIELVRDDSAVVQIAFVAKHHPGLSFDSWLDRQFSTTATELPAGLDSSERAAIEAGRYEVGMSRAAMFLSIGYPPTTLSPNPNDTLLTYEIKRFNRIAFTFDAKDRVVSIKS